MNQINQGQQNQGVGKAVSARADRRVVDSKAADRISLGSRNRSRIVVAASKATEIGKVAVSSNAN